MSTSLSAILLASVFLILLGGCQATDTSQVSDSPLRMYVGSYTNTPAKGKGIYLFELDRKTGALTEVAVAAELKSPSFLAMTPDHSHLYCIGEVPEFKGKKMGAVSAFGVDRSTGKLKLLNQEPSGGAGPCHVSITADGKTVLVANYAGGSVASFPVKQDGSVGGAASIIQHTGKGTDPGRQEGPHAHGIWPAPGGKFVVACDLGLDKVMVYRRDPATSKLIILEDHAGKVPDGAGARHIVFSPNHQHLYVINEMGNTVTAFGWNAKAGSLSAIQTINTLPEGFSGKSYTAEVAIHPTGKFLYGSNRGHDSVTVFAVDSKTGKLTYLDNTPIDGKWPRHIALDPSGHWLIAAGEHSDTLTVFKVDQATGKLTQAGKPVNCPAPGCVIFAPMP